jgi:hypothetical protein
MKSRSNDTICLLSTSRIADKNSKSCCTAKPAANRAAIGSALHSSVPPALTRQFIRNTTAADDSLHFSRDRYQVRYPRPSATRETPLLAQIHSLLRDTFPPGSRRSLGRAVHIWAALRWDSGACMRRTVDPWLANSQAFLRIVLNHTSTIGLTSYRQVKPQAFTHV